MARWSTTSSGDGMEQLGSLTSYPRRWWALRRVLRRGFSRLTWRFVEYAHPDSPEIPGLWRRYGAHIGENVDIDPTCFLDRGFASLLRIDESVVVAMGTAFLLHDSSINNVTGGPLRVGRIHVCRGAYVGAFSIVLPGVTIGEGAIVGAGSLVASDVAAGTVAFGRPARVAGSTADLAERFAIRANVPRPGELFFPFPSQAAQARLPPEEMRAIFRDLTRRLEGWSQG